MLKKELHCAIFRRHRILAPDKVIVVKPQGELLRPELTRKNPLEEPIRVAKIRNSKGHGVEILGNQNECLTEKLQQLIGSIEVVGINLNQHAGGDVQIDTAT